MNRSVYLAIAFFTVGCATSKPEPVVARPGPVGVLFTPPKGFELTRNRGLTSEMFVSPQTLAGIHVTDVPLPLDARSAKVSGEDGQLDQPTVDRWAAWFTREPGAKLTSARSLFWRQEAHMGALEVLYSLPSVGLGADIKYTARVALVLTAKGVSVISFYSVGETIESDIATWNEIINNISVESAA